MSSDKRSVVAATLGLALCHASAAVPEWRSGSLQTIYTDPSDVVLVLNQPGPCGSNFYYIPRTNTNFKEFYAAMLLAFAAGKNVSIYIVSCSSDRNVLSHGNVTQ